MNVDTAISRLRAADPALTAVEPLTTAADIRQRAIFQVSDDHDAVTRTRESRRRMVSKRAKMVPAAVALAAAAAVTPALLGPSAPAAFDSRAYAVHPHPDGSIELIFNEQEFFQAEDAAKLGAVLTEAGLPATVLVGSAAGTCHQPQVEAVQNAKVGGLITGIDVVDGKRIITLQPDAMPGGTQLLVVVAPASVPVKDKINSFDVTRHAPSCVTYVGWR